MAKQVWIDCDPGLDDAIALMVLASRPDAFSLRGITTAAGNQTGEKTFRNARRIGAYLGLQAPVARGADRPLRRPPLTAGDVHGEDGLAGMRAGNSLLPGDPRPAAEFLCDSLTAAEEPAVLIATGPLTNLAELFAREPGVQEKIDHITIMGGSLSGGNVTPYAEFNFCADPDAAQAVLCAGVPIHLLGLDVTHQAYLADEEIRAFGGLGTKHGGMVGDLMAFYAASYKKTGLPGTPVHDASAVLYEAEPSLFPGAEALSLEVVTSGERIGECVRKPGGPPNVRWVTSVRRAEFVEALFSCCR